MAQSTRPFRTRESLDSEIARRDAIKPLLERHGYSDIVDRREVRGTSTSQLISGRDPNGVRIRARVRLCWRREGRKVRERDYSAAQLRAHLIAGDWSKTLAHIVEREREHGNTHNLFVQDEGDACVFAAMAPSQELQAIWEAQRDQSDTLIAEGLMGRIRKNHAANGTSPTIWLQDDRTPHAHAVADLFWNWPGVVNVLAFAGPKSEAAVADTFDDLPIDPSLLGRDLGSRVRQVRSGFARDQKVRQQVIRRANGKCERSGCGARRPYEGFLDVHHILGVWASDRVWSCVALCPNCHREAHVSPERDRLNAELQAYALRYGET